MAADKIRPNLPIMKQVAPTGAEKMAHSWKGHFLKLLSGAKALGISVSLVIKKGKEMFKTRGTQEAWQAKKVTKIQEQATPVKLTSKIGQHRLQIQPSEVTKAFPAKPGKEPSPFVSEETVSLKTAPPIPQLTQERAQTIQEELKSRNIPLTCREFKTPEADKRNKLNQEQVDTYLAAVKQELLGGNNPLSEEQADRLIAAKRKLFENTQCLTYEHLGKALSGCTQKLNTLLGGQNYAIGYAEQKSQKWIAEQALPLMEKTPKKAFKTYAEGVEHTYQEKLPEDIENFVVFDDASYSGSQMAALLKDLVQKMKELPSQKPRKIYFVIPFMSTQAKQRIQTEWAKILKESPEKLASFPELCVITSDQGLTGFSDVFPPESIALEDLGRFEYEKKNREVHKRLPQLDTPEAVMPEPGAADAWGEFASTPKSQYDFEMEMFEKKLKVTYSSEKCLAFMEWKTPDNVSVPEYLHSDSCGKTSYTFLNTKFLPPYKSPPTK